MWMYIKDLIKKTNEQQDKGHNNVPVHNNHEEEPKCFMTLMDFQGWWICHTKGH